MDIRAAEISAILKEQIKDFGKEAEVTEVGQVLSVGDGIARVYGLDNVQAGEMVEFPGGIRGMALNLEVDNVGIVIFGSDRDIKEGDTVQADGQRSWTCRLARACLAVLSTVSVTRSTARGRLRPTEMPPRGREGARHHSRASRCTSPCRLVLRPWTALIPVGRGQRELIIGDRQTGKTADHSRHDPQSEVDQRVATMKVVPTSIAFTWLSVRSARPLPSFVKVLEENGALPYSIVVAATASDPAPMQFLAPFTGCTMGEYFRDNGMHAHRSTTTISPSRPLPIAKCHSCFAVRQGREAYPGDVFYLHSAAARTRRETERRQWRRIADRTAGHRNPGQRRVGLYSDERHLDHRRADLP